MKTIIKSIAVLFLSYSVCGAMQDVLKVYLPRNIEVQCDTVKLGDVAVLNGPEEIKAKAESISLGKVSKPGSSIVIDKTTIQSLLAAEDMRNIALSGANEIKITRAGFKISSAQLLEEAKTELAKNAGLGQVKYKAISEPKEILVDGPKSETGIQAVCEPKEANGKIKTKLLITCKDKEIAQREVVFAPTYIGKRAIAIKDIGAGTIISKDNTRIEDFESTTESIGWQEPYGLSAKRMLRANTVISNDMVQAAVKPIVISRNQGVTIQFKQPGLIVSAMGEALQDGRVNECIKVRNIDSQKVLVARVNEDGSVEPVF